MCKVCRVQDTIIETIITHPRYQEAVAEVLIGQEEWAKKGEQERRFLLLGTLMHGLLQTVIEQHGGEAASQLLEAEMAALAEAEGRQLLAQILRGGEGSAVQASAIADLLFGEEGEQAQGPEPAPAGDEYPRATRGPIVVLPLRHE